MDVVETPKTSLPSTTYTYTEKAGFLEDCHLVWTGWLAGWNSSALLPHLPHHLQAQIPYHSSHHQASYDRSQFTPHHPPPPTPCSSCTTFTHVPAHTLPLFTPQAWVRRPWDKPFVAHEAAPRLPMPPTSPSLSLTLSWFAQWIQHSPPFSPLLVTRTAHAPRTFALPHIAPPRWQRGQHRCYFS